MCLAIFLLDTWVPAKGKEKENEEVAKKILQYGATHADISKNVKSLRYFRHGIGGSPPGRRVLITEFASLSDMDTFFKKLGKETEWREIIQEWRDVTEQTTTETLLWNDQHRKLWTEK
jgi:hypothetical protein